MALNDDATLVIGAGNFFTGTVGTALPADLTAPGAPWTNVGHTSLEDIFSITSEGGEATTIGSLQKKALRTRRTPRVETFGFTLQQFDTAGLRLYFGSNATTGPAGELRVPQDPQPTITAFLVVFLDGENVFAFHAEKAEILRADDMSLADTESLAGLPLGVTPLVNGANTWPYTVTPLDAVPAA